MRSGFVGCATMVGIVLLAASGDAARPGAAPEVPLVVIVDSQAEDAAGNETHCRICGDGTDGSAVYVHGEEGVTARLDQYGNLIINFNATRSATPRRLTFVYDDPVVPGTLEPPSISQSSYMSTRYGTLGKIQHMAEGDIQCVESAITFRVDDRTEIQNLFRRGATLQDTSYVVVTRLPNQANGKGTWRVEPTTFVGDTVNGCNAPETATVARVKTWILKGTGTATDYGNWRMPFRMTLTEK